MKKSVKKSTKNKLAHLSRKRHPYFGLLIGIITFLILVVILFLVYWFSLPSKEVSFCQELASVNLDLSVRYDDYYDYMSSNAFLTDCLIDLAVKRKDYDICDDLKSRFVDNDFYVPVCYGAVAGKKRSCDLFYSRDSPLENVSRTRCLAGVGFVNHDSTVCFDSHPGLESSCIDMVAESLGDYKMCDVYTYLDERGKDVSHYDECLFGVLNNGHRGSTRKEVFLDYNMCFKFRKNDYRNLCFRKMAIRHRDISICKFILSKDDREECFRTSQAGWSEKNAPYEIVKS